MITIGSTVKVQGVRGYAVVIGHTSGWAQSAYVVQFPSGAIHDVPSDRMVIR